MSKNVSIEQKQGLGNSGTQIGVQNNYGLTATEATQMAFSIFREYYPTLRDEALAELHKLVTKKLNTIPQENIIPPSPRIAVPSLQNASITEEQDIRELYANLLTNSMNKVVKDGVHPGFVEIIKQLTPDEAKVMQYIYIHRKIPTISLKFKLADGGYIESIKDFSNIGIIVGCEKPFDIYIYFSNLVRLGLIENQNGLNWFSDESKYEPLKSHPFITALSEKMSITHPELGERFFSESYVSISAYGNDFCRICLSSPTTTIQKEQ